MSYEAKLERAKEIIAAHNGQVDEEGRVDTDEFIRSLKRAGGTSAEALASCSFEDLEAFGLPRLLARCVATEFRTGVSAREKVVIGESHAKGMDVADLVGQYDPHHPDNAVGVQLKTVSRGRRCLVFREDGNVDVEATTRLIQEIQDGHREREALVVPGQLPRKTYRIGERPDHVSDVNPLYPGELLRPDETCDRTGRSWTGVPLAVRQLVYLARTRTGEIRINGLDDAHRVLDLALGQDAAEVLRRRYPKSSVLYGDLERIGELPSLKVALNGGAARPNDPFGGGNRAY